MTIIDVRTPSEFNGGNVVGSVNIPLSDIEKKVVEITKMTKPIYLCCASGARSGSATFFLKSQGVDCNNVGSWFAANSLTKGEMNV